MPVADQRRPLLLEHGAVTRALESDAVETLVPKAREDRKELLDVAVEAAEDDDRAA